MKQSCQIQPFASSELVQLPGQQVRAELRHAVHAANVVGPAVVHIVGRITEDVFSFLGPLTQTLAAKGITQAIILRDEPAFRHLMTKFDPLVQLVILPSSANLIRRMRHMHKALMTEASAPTTVYCHFHGVVPSVVGAWASRVSGLKSRILFSPHGSRSLGPFKPIGAAIVRALHITCRERALVPIANSGEDGRRVARFSGQAVTVIESPVDDAFFYAVRVESPFPTVLAGAGLPDAMAAARFAQLAVLFWDESIAVRFVWVGPVDAESRDRLKAAGVNVHDTSDEAKRALMMSSSWAFLSLGGSDGFPSLLAEAMAVGVACIAWNQANHRDFIDHDINGLMVSSEGEALDALARLMRFASLRELLGASARKDAARRFNRGRFDAAILQAYGHAT